MLSGDVFQEIKRVTQCDGLYHIVFSDFHETLRIHEPGSLFTVLQKVRILPNVKNPPPDDS